MRVLFDVAHPAHAHQFRVLAFALLARGHEIRVVGRDKDVTRSLLEASGLPFEVPPAPHGPRGRLRDARELVTRVLALRRIVRTWRPDMLLTRNPAGAIAAFATRTHSVFDTDDGRQVGAHYWLARPFADTMTSSVHDPEDHGRGHRRYPGFKALAFLDPRRFVPDPAVRMQLGIPDGLLFVVRFSAHDASHDRRISGIASGAADELVTLLSAHGSVVVTREGRPTVLLTADGERAIPVDRFHDVLAHADLCVGDSQSVAIESAVLGVPSIRLSGFTGRHFSLSLLEDRYGLIVNLSPGEEGALLEAVASALRELPSRRAEAAVARTRLLDEAGDLTGWFIELVEGTHPRSG